MADKETDTVPDLDDFNRHLDGYAPAYEDSGYKIELNGTPAKADSFEGIFTGTKVFPNVHNEFTGKDEDVTMLLFTDLTGARCNMWASYALTQAMDSGKLVPGKQVMLIHQGKESIKDGKQQLTKISVYVKDPDKNNAAKA
jgi:hypothetical protein